MNYWRLTVVLIIFIHLSCSEQKPGLLLVNDSNFDRIDEPVTLAKSALVGIIGAIPDNMIAMPVSLSGDTIPFQVDDLDGDGAWDELFFLFSSKAGDKQKIYFRFIDISDIPVFPKRTDVRFIEAFPPYRNITTAERLRSKDSESSSAVFYTEGPVWENDRVAFRNYFDARNGIDIYGKKVNRLVFGDTAFVHQDYHQMQDWGMDILKVANSLGAGAIGLSIKGSPFRIDSAETATFRLISAGPLRAVLEFGFIGWKANDRHYDIHHRISICGGAEYYLGQVTVSGLHGDENLLTGIVNLHSDTLILNSETESVVIAATHDKQAYLGEYLGLGILLNSADFIDTITAPEEGEGITQTYMLRMKIAENIPVKFRFYAGWEYQNTAYSNREKFMDLLQSDAEKMASPLVIKGL